jgi:hypothetical protein
VERLSSGALGDQEMRRLTYAVMAPIGPWMTPRSGSLADLVLALPYVVLHEIPPRRVLNDILVRGVLDAGMSGGCIWKPLELDQLEFEDLVGELQRRGPGRGDRAGQPCTAGPEYGIRALAR